MKKVHDILNFDLPEKINFATGGRERLSFPVAFIQHGNEEEGFEYEGICPYCAESIGLVSPEGNMGLRNQALALMMAAHYKTGCVSFGAHHFQVEKATAPLGTERKPSVH